MNTFKFDSANESHQHLLTTYMNHPNTPYNNSTLLSIDRYDNVGGAMFMVETGEEIIATYGILNIEMESGVNVAKLSRLHVREDYRDQLNTLIDEYLDPQIYQWISENNIRNVMKTVNIGNEQVTVRAWKRLLKKRLYALDHLNSHGREINEHVWTVLPYLIKELGVWQYCTWTSLDDISWNSEWRETTDITDDYIINELNSNFTRTSEGWII